MNNLIESKFLLFNIFFKKQLLPEKNSHEDGDGEDENKRKINTIEQFRGS